MDRELMLVPAYVSKIFDIKTLDYFKIFKI